MPFCSVLYAPFPSSISLLSMPYPQSSVLHYILRKGFKHAFIHATEWQ